MIRGESNIYVVVAPAGGLVGVHLDQESAARTQAALVQGVVGLVPVVADFRKLPVSAVAALDTAWSGPLLGPVDAEARAMLPHGLTGAERHAADMRRCCESEYDTDHRPDCASWRPLMDRPTRECCKSEAGVGALRARTCPNWGS